MIEPHKEILDRVRRIETRVTKVANHLGLGPPTEKARFAVPPNSRMAVIDLPSPHCSLKEIIDIIPDTWEGPVGVFVGDQLVATVDKSREP